LLAHEDHRTAVVFRHVVSKYADRRLVEIGVVGAPRERVLQIFPAALAILVTRSPDASQATGLPPVGPLIVPDNSEDYAGSRAVHVINLPRHRGSVVPRRNGYGFPAAQRPRGWVRRAVGR